MYIEHYFGTMILHFLLIAKNKEYNLIKNRYYKILNKRIDEVYKLKEKIEFIENNKCVSTKMKSMLLQEVYQIAIESHLFLKIYYYRI